MMREGGKARGRRRWLGAWRKRMIFSGKRGRERKNLGATGLSVGAYAPLTGPVALAGVSPGAFSARTPVLETGRFSPMMARPLRAELRASRNPRLLLRLPGELLFRLAARQLEAELFQLPPRLTRLEPDDLSPYFVRRAVAG